MGTLDTNDFRWGYFYLLDLVVFVYVYRYLVAQYQTEGFPLEGLPVSTCSLVLLLGVLNEKVLMEDSHGLTSLNDFPCPVLPILVIDLDLIEHIIYHFFLASTVAS